MYRKIIFWLLVFSISSSVVSLSTAQATNSIYMDSSKNRELPPQAQQGLWLGAYVGSLYLMSRLNNADLALGLFYAVPALLPFYQWEPENAGEKDLGLSGENLVFASLSLYNFFAIDPESQSDTKIFQQNLLANAILWSGLIYYRKRIENHGYLLLPMVGNSNLGVTLVTDF